MGWNAPANTAGTDEDNLKRAASRWGVNYGDLKNLVTAEGGWTAPYSHFDVNGPSYGILQMHSGPKGGLADEFRKATGHDPSDPKYRGELIDFGVHWGATHGWNAWSTVKSGKVGAPRSTGTGFGGGSGDQAKVVDDMMKFSGVGRADPRIRAFMKEHGVDLDPRGAAWCAAWLQAMFNAEGISGGKGNMAAAWGTYGSAVSAGQAKKGDVVVRMGSSIPGISGHVGEFTGEYNDKGEMQVIAGNTGGKVGYWYADPNNPNIRVRRGSGAATTGPVYGSYGTGEGGTYGTGERAIQMPAGAGAEPRGEAAAIGAAAKNIWLFEDALGNLTKAVQKAADTIQGAATNKSNGGGSNKNSSSDYYQQP